MRFRRRRPIPDPAEYMHEVTQAGPMVILVLGIRCEGMTQPIASFTMAMTPECAAQLHRDLSLAAEKARRHRD